MANKVIQLSDGTDKLYPQGAVIDISSSITYNLSSGTGTAKGLYEPTTGRVTISFGVLNATNVDTSTYMFTIASAYRPKSNITVPMLTRTTDGAWLAYQGAVLTTGGIQQKLTATATGCYGFFEYII